MYAIVLLCILAALVLFFFHRSAAGKVEPEEPIPTYTCHSCDQQDCECTQEEEPDTTEKIH